MALPLPIVLLDPELSVAAKIASFAAPTAVHFAIGNVVEPLLFGYDSSLHPVTVLIALAVWYALWGIPGAILAVPLTAVLRIVLSSSDHAYASIVVAVMEGRVSEAATDFDNTLGPDAGGERGEGAPSPLPSNGLQQHGGTGSGSCPPSPILKLGGGAAEENL